MELLEISGDWHLILHDARVQMIQIDFRLGLLVGDDSGTAQIRIETPFDFEHSDGERLQIIPDKAETIFPLLKLANHRVLFIRARSDGSLSMEFEGGCRIYVGPDAEYEAWQLSCDNKMLVSGPEGKVAYFLQ